MPIDFKIKIRQSELKIRFKKRIPKLLDEAAKATIQGIVKGIFDQRKPDGSAQRKNRRSTVQNKKKRGVRPNIPLHDEGFFVSERTYKVERGVNKRTVSVGRRQGRDKIQKKLAKDGYEFMGLYRSAKKKIDLIVKKELAKIITITTPKVEVIR